MLSPQWIRTKPRLPITFAPQCDPSPELSRVFAAAVIDQGFCDMLLINPHEALNNGYLGESFRLSHEERDLIVSIRAASLTDLARQVNSALGN